MSAGVTLTDTSKRGVNMKNIFTQANLERFWDDTDGAVTVQWVVLTATAAAMAISVAMAFDVTDPTNSIGYQLGITNALLELWSSPSAFTTTFPSK